MTYSHHCHHQCAECRQETGYGIVIAICMGLGALLGVGIGKLFRLPDPYNTGFVIAGGIIGGIAGFFLLI